ncbi:DUF952 domain-containing protein [Williamsia sp. CHRR-6]|uniref:DUF952 domain-containing protein n=1 Tax=Williamsia sp. CHRR-6 TaxID=2835871 RepID=UPI001BDA578B|nr:DUF952 domain-containing protein [Williamsia sp. CHRR-6]MBT0567935.1 DUF952 domain-containing protein [Williamsia sp. CHRR-6]
MSDDAGAATLVHMCSQQEWDRVVSEGQLRPAADVGFIHLSARGQVHIPANLFYRGRTDLVLLEVDESLLDASVVWEQGVPAHPDGILFPHLYAPLPAAAVSRVSRYRPEPDGTFAPLR